MTVRNLTRAADVASRLDVAVRTLDRMRGLLGRAAFEPGAGLWIAPCTSIHTLGMRFAIDAVFLDGKGSVLRSYHDLAPGRVTRIVWKAAGVLELPAGTLRATGTEVGDRLDLGIEPRLALGLSGPRTGEHRAPLVDSQDPARTGTREALKLLPFSLDQRARIPVYPSRFERIGRLAR